MSSVSAGNQSPLFIWEPAGLAGLLLLRTSLSCPFVFVFTYYCVCVMSPSPLSLVHQIHSRKLRQ